MNETILRLSFFIVVVFAIIGMVTVGVTVHELTHYSEMRKNNESIKDICVLNLPLNNGILTGNIGYVLYHPKNETDRYTETKPFIAGNLVVIFFLIAFIIFLVKWFNYRLWEKYWRNDER